MLPGGRFLLVATPSGLSLAPEGGAHQSIITPLIGIGQPGLTAFEPAFVDELTAILAWSLPHIQADDGGAVYLRLTTRPVDQPDREMTPGFARVVHGGYWLIHPAPMPSWRSSAPGRSPPRRSRPRRSAMTSPAPA